MAVKHSIGNIEYSINVSGVPFSPITHAEIWGKDAYNLDDDYPDNGDLPKLIDAVSIDWNNAYLPSQEKYINNVSDLLEIIDENDASKQYVDNAISNVIGLAPQALDTLEEIADECQKLSGLCETINNNISSSADSLYGIITNAEKRLTGVIGSALSGTNSQINTIKRDISGPNGYAYRISGLEERVSGIESGITVSDELIAASITALDGKYSTIQQTVNNIRTEVYGAYEGEYSRIDQTYNRIEQDVFGASGLYSTVTQTADRINAEVHGLSGLESSINLNAQAFWTALSGNDGVWSSIYQTKDEILAKVEEELDESSISMITVEGGSSMWLIQSDSNYTIPNTNQNWETDLVFKRNGANLPILTENTAEGMLNFDSENPKAYLIDNGNKIELSDNEFTYVTEDLVQIPLLDADLPFKSKITIKLNLNALLNSQNGHLNTWNNDSSTKIIRFTLYTSTNNKWNEIKSSTDYAGLINAINDVTNEDIRTVDYDIQILKIPAGQNGSATVDPMNMYKLVPTTELATVNAIGELQLNIHYQLHHTSIDANGKTQINGYSEIPDTFELRYSDDNNFQDETKSFNLKYAQNATAAYSCSGAFNYGDREHYMDSSEPAIVLRGTAWKESINNSDRNFKIYTPNYAKLTFIKGSGPSDAPQTIEYDNYYKLTNKDEDSTVDAFKYNKFDFNRIRVELWDVAASPTSVGVFAPTGGSVLLERRYIPISIKTSSIIDVKKDAIRLASQSAISGIRASLDISGEGTIESKVAEIFGPDYSLISQKVSGINLEVFGSNGIDSLRSLIDINTTGISSRVTYDDLDGRLETERNQTATAIWDAVWGEASGISSKITQTAGDIWQTISGATGTGEGGLWSTIHQSITGIELKLADTGIDINNKKITIDANNTDFKGNINLKNPDDGLLLYDNNDNINVAILNQDIAKDADKNVKLIRNSSNSIIDSQSNNIYTFKHEGIRLNSYNKNNYIDIYDFLTYIYNVNGGPLDLDNVKVLCEVYNLNNQGEKVILNSFHNYMYNGNNANITLYYEDIIYRGSTTISMGNTGALAEYIITPPENETATHPGKVNNAGIYFADFTITYTIVNNDNIIYNDLKSFIRFTTNSVGALTQQLIGNDGVVFKTTNSNATITNKMVINDSGILMQGGDNTLNINSTGININNINSIIYKHKSVNSTNTIEYWAQEDDVFIELKGGVDIKLPINSRATSGKVYYIVADTEGGGKKSHITCNEDILHIGGDNDGRGSIGLNNYCLYHCIKADMGWIITASAYGL